jgi:hypothetical protein
MPTYLLNWNPRKWEWTHFHDQLRELAERGSFMEPWDTGASRRLKEGDRVFLIRQGVEPRGIIASGEVRGAPYQDEHWTGDGRQANYVAIEWDQMFDPLVDVIISRDELDRLQPMHWDAQRSGTRIPNEVAAELEREWATVVERNEKRKRSEPR